MSIWSDINKGKLIAVILILILTVVLVRQGGLEFTRQEDDADSSAVAQATQQEADTEPPLEEPALAADPTGSVVTDGLDTASYERITPAEIAASSSLHGSKGIYGPELTQDGDVNTCWQDGVDGYGEGESITASLEEGTLLKAVGLSIGNQTSRTRYENNGRPARVTLSVTLEDGRTCEYAVDLADQMEPQGFVFDEPVSASGVTLAIGSVYEGAKFEDTCIAEIWYLADAGQDGDTEQAQDAAGDAAAQ